MPAGTVSLAEENARLRKALKEREAEIAFLKKQRRTSQRCRNEVRLS